MTRINCVPVKTLTNEFLAGEHKEITRPFNKVKSRIAKGNTGIRKIPKYKMGDGHETFFFDKLRWLNDRRAQIVEEMIDRGMSPDLEKFNDISDDFEATLGHTQFWNDWEPSQEDMMVNMQRLVERHFG